MVAHDFADTSFGVFQDGNVDRLDVDRAREAALFHGDMDRLMKPF